jgi:hypothetical protein
MITSVADRLFCIPAADSTIFRRFLFAVDTKKNTSSMTFDGHIW